MTKKHDRSKWGTAWRDGLVTTSLGWDLALPIFGGVLLGHFLDRWLHTGYVLTLGLLALGTITGFYNVARAIRREIARDRRRAQREKQEHEAK
jgi:F0F1-type ATP synthase assembly protein I